MHVGEACGGGGGILVVVVVVRGAAAAAGEEGEAGVDGFVLEAGGFCYQGIADGREGGEEGGDHDVWVVGGCG